MGQSTLTKSKGGYRALVHRGRVFIIANTRHKLLDKGASRAKIEAGNKACHGGNSRVGIAHGGCAWAFGGNCNRLILDKDRCLRGGLGRGIAR